MSSHLAPRAATISLCVLGIIGAACEQLPEVRYETEHLRIGTDFDARLCQGNLDHYERVITTLEDQLATSVDGQFEVYLWDLAEHSAGPGWCELEQAYGCFQGASSTPRWGRSTMSSSTS